jgi:hypothetical protein
MTGPDPGGPNTYGFNGSGSVSKALISTSLLNCGPQWNLSFLTKAILGIYMKPTRNEIVLLVFRIRLLDPGMVII